MYRFAPAYNFVLITRVPPHKCIETVKGKLIEAYGEDEAHKRYKRKQKGLAVFRVVVLQPKRLILVAATPGKHSKFFLNRNVVNLRKRWAEYDIYELRKDPTKQDLVKVRVRADVFTECYNRLKLQILTKKKNELETELKSLPWIKSRDTQLQRVRLIKMLNRQRKIHSKPLIRPENAMP